MLADHIRTKGNFDDHCKSELCYIMTTAQWLCHSQGNNSNRWVCDRRHLIKWVLLMQTHRHTHIHTHRQSELKLFYYS